MDLKQNIIGEIGEQLVVVELLKSGFKEVYRANSKTQKGWDIVVITKKNKIIRIQVKTTFLDNNSTNNSVSLKGKYDFLALVILGTKNRDVKFFCLKREIVEQIQGDCKKLAISDGKGGVKKVKYEIEKYKVTGKEDWIEKLGIKDVI